MKYRGIKIIKKPSFCRFIPGLSYTAQAIYPYIFVTTEIFENLCSENPNPRFIAILKHEKKHIERQKSLGLVNFGITYLFSSEFRFQEELSATREEMKYLKQNKLDFDTEKSAKFLSSWLYLWMVPYEKAKRELDKIWN
ncbi:hypothetical protein COY33_01950 [candidate division WWE3 bacterium CG_4_10_14_0_2_um_filter_42_7]|uniref:Peptidase M48 domain-containing protein n=2 Tax=Katanobacteria TaxID=422282 RepID=A0A2H0X9Y6_UNCKA|nr:MAG: hypothetical protein COT51_01240 [candidate division WWE3 bacterium CG08_land_8_20_14_0_20_41_15]PIZ43196.1 MAG: hypothetical protein COY33_01950 [candidate division WWE3 bacterium CG_4_10_14_0_2_um_filter_42_7]